MYRYFQDRQGRQRSSAEPHSAMSQACLKVLLIEPDSGQELLLRRMLQTLKIWSVTVVLDCEDGLALLAQPDCHYDIVICDEAMTPIDGIAFIRAAAAFRVGQFILTADRDIDLPDLAKATLPGGGAPQLAAMRRPFAVETLKHILAAYCNGNCTGPACNRAGPARRWSKSDIVSALSRDQFTPYFQPKIDLASGIATDVEILARWMHPDLGILAPAEFIGLMEQEGLIDQLSDTMFRQALAHTRNWAARGLRVGLALNISPLTLQNTEMTNRIVSVVKEYEVCPSQVTIEVTETALSQYPADFQATITRLRMKGFGISIDDFGIGYSSLQQLSQIPFTELKIDRSFVSGGPVTDKSISILESILDLANKLHMRTVAEGIETAREFHSLRSLGCSLGQGYLFAKPMSSADFMNWHATNHETPRNVYGPQEAAQALCIEDAGCDAA